MLTIRDKLGRFIKGHRSSPQTEFKKGENLGKKHHLWKEKGASYTAIHMYLYRNFGKAYKCENKKCSYINPKKYEWANISGTYKRTMKDWKMLCVSCHKKLDLNRKKEK